VRGAEALTAPFLEEEGGTVYTGGEAGASLEYVEGKGEGLDGPRAGPHDDALDPKPEEEGVS
jgi:hypothetical protein